MTSEITAAIKNICDEKGISYESVLETVQAALAAAYRKDYGNKMQNIQVEFDPETQAIKAFDVKTVVEDLPEEEQEAVEALKEGVLIEPPDAKKKEEAPIGEEKEVSADAEEEEEKRHFNPKTEIQLKDAPELKKNAKIGDVIRTRLEVPGGFGRMAAQTAKQVIIQKLREAERETVFAEYKDKEGTVITGTVQRREGRMVLIDLGKTIALLPSEEQIHRESYVPGEHLKLYVVSVDKTTKGPEIIVSRSRPEIVKQFFEMEIPEIANGTVEIKSVAREAGSRTKIAVWTDEDNIDPIGSCIGQRGARVQTIISELKGEKIDIVEYSTDPEEYILNALSPARISGIKLNEEENTAIVSVAEDQLSLAIGKSGQNVRLAAKLTGWKIDIVTEGGEKIEPKKPQDAEAEEAPGNEEDAGEEVSAAEPAKETKEEAKDDESSKETKDAPEKKKKTAKKKSKEEK